MKIRIIATALALCLALPVAAGPKSIQKGHELPINHVRLPATENGTIAFKTCGNCPYTTKRLSSDIEWRFVVDPVRGGHDAAQVQGPGRAAKAAR